MKLPEFVVDFLKTHFIGVHLLFCDRVWNYLNL